MKISGKNALITGACRGIGKAIAIALAEDGFNIILHHNESDPAPMLSHMKRIGVHAAAIQANLEGGAQAANELFDAAVEQFGKINILVNNAAIANSMPIAEVSEELFDRMFAINVKSVYFMCKKAIGCMPEGGKVFNISGVGTRMMVPGFSCYLSTKGAIEQMTRSLAVEAAERGISINAIAPGATATQMTLDCNTQEAISAVEAMTAYKRLGQPEEIASLLALLARDEAQWLTGQVIHANGGLL